MSGQLATLLATDRAELKAALDTAAADGIRGHLHRPTAPRAGDAWPTLPAVEQDSTGLWRPEWTVHVWLPQDERAASTWLDSHLDTLLEALAGGDFYPERAEPVAIDTTAGVFKALEITVRSNH